MTVLQTEQVVTQVMQVMQVTQVTQVTQVDAGDAGDTEGSDAPVARSNKRGGKKNMSAVRRRRQAMAKAARESDSEGGA